MNHSSLHWAGLFFLNFGDLAYLELDLSYFDLLSDPCWYFLSLRIIPKITLLVDLCFLILLIYTF